VAWRGVAVRTWSKFRSMRGANPGATTGSQSAGARPLTDLAVALKLVPHRAVALELLGGLLDGLHGGVVVAGALVDAWCR
jgi:hypothetical protein